MNNMDIFTQAYINILLEDLAKQAEVQSVDVQVQKNIFNSASQSQAALKSFSKSLGNNTNTTISKFCKNFKHLLSTLEKKLKSDDLIKK